MDTYFFLQDEPARSCLQFLRSYILGRDKNITEAWKYGMPFYCYRVRCFAACGYIRSITSPYIGIVEGKSINHPDLLIERRARMKILLVDPTKSLPMKKIDSILKEVLGFYKKEGSPFF